MNFQEDEQCADTNPQKPKESPISSRCYEKKFDKKTPTKSPQVNPLETIDVLLQEIKSYKEGINSRPLENPNQQMTKKKTLEDRTNLQRLSSQRDEKDFQSNLLNTSNDSSLYHNLDNTLRNIQLSNERDISSTFTFYQKSPQTQKENWNATPKKYSNCSPLTHQNKQKYKEFDNFHYFYAESDQVEQDLTNTLKRLRDMDAKTKRSGNRQSSKNQQKTINTQYYDTIKFEL